MALRDEDRVARLEEGTAFADLSDWRKIEVPGGDAIDWLNDLVTADVRGLAPGTARRSLLLSRTGGVRAEFTVAAFGGDILLLQDPRQPSSVTDLLSPYVLSSDVALVDQSGEIALFAFPGLAAPTDVAAARPSAPSVLGSGSDLLAGADNGHAVRAELERTLVPVTSAELEEWRILAGLPAVGVDVQPDDLPAEAGLDEAVAIAKGCYLGQEAVAKARNLGHPRRVLVALETDAPVAHGEVVVGPDGEQAGLVTSAVARKGGTAALARVKWSARSGPFTTGGGIALRPRPVRP
jgi:folate-binding protein YgfZ